MAIPAWPSTLPATFTMDSFTEAMGDGRLQAQTDIGPGKSRRRFSAVVRPITGTLVMTQDQVAEFETFVNDDLAGGTLPFTMQSQRGSGDWLVKLADEMPTWRRVSNGKWAVDLKLVIMP